MLCYEQVQPKAIHLPHHLIVATYVSNLFAVGPVHSSAFEAVVESSLAFLSLIMGWEMTEWCSEKEEEVGQSCQLEDLCQAWRGERCPAQPSPGT